MRDKATQYAYLIMSQVFEMMEDEDSEFFIDRQEFNDPDNLTDFIHALANMAPAAVYQRLTGDEKTSLEFNHLANQLVFQNSTLVKEEKQ